jgi:peptidoglycan hydrolase CwlO-like protein
MIDKLASLKQTNKPLFYISMILLLIPLLGLIFLAFISPNIKEWLKLSAQKLLSDTTKKDDKLKQDIENLQNEVKKSEKVDQSLKEEIEKVENDVDENWHKKK